ncbi:hypothetical protein HUJ04_012313, partial [Dendroctonus ponderosae]
ICVSYSFHNNLLFQQLHSEYRSTYRWHEYTGPRQEVVRKPPIQNGVPAAGVASDHNEKAMREDEFQTDSAQKQEPVMPRRKKYPDLAYRHHEFLVSDGVTANGGVDSRARESPYKNFLCYQRRPARYKGLE